MSQATSHRLMQETTIEEQENGTMRKAKTAGLTAEEIERRQKVAKRKRNSRAAKAEGGRIESSLSVDSVTDSLLGKVATLMGKTVSQVVSNLIAGTPDVPSMNRIRWATPVGARPRTPLTLSLSASDWEYLRSSPDLNATAVCELLIINNAIHADEGCVGLSDLTGRVVTEDDVEYGFLFLIMPGLRGFFYTGSNDYAHSDPPKLRGAAKYQARKDTIHTLSGGNSRGLSESAELNKDMADAQDAAMMRFIEQRQTAQRVSIDRYNYEVAGRSQGRPPEYVDDFVSPHEGEIIG